MRILIFRPKSLPLPIPNLDNSEVSLVRYKDCDFIKYILDLDTFMERIQYIISESNLGDIPQLIYVKNLPAIFNLTDEYSRFPNVYLLSDSNGYFSNCLISNAKYIKPTNVEVGSAYDLIERMYRDYKANKLREIL